MGKTKNRMMKLSLFSVTIIAGIFIYMNLLKGQDMTEYRVNPALDCIKPDWKGNIVINGKFQNDPRWRGHLSVSCPKSNPFFAAQHTDYMSARAGVIGSDGFYSYASVIARSATTKQSIKEHPTGLLHLSGSQ
jgi:hypothetical protein